MVASAADWLARSDWQRRTPEFGELVDRGGQTVFAWQSAAQIWPLWERIPREHHNIIAVAAPGELHYAALDWSRERATIGTDADVAIRVATWGTVVARALQDVLDRVRADEAGWFTRPVVRFDLEGAIRIAFATPDDPVPRGDERAMVLVVGRVLRELADLPLGGQLRAISARCTERDPAQRYARLEALCSALRDAGGRTVVRSARRKVRAEWALLETGLGRLAAGDPVNATLAFELAKHAELKEIATARLSPSEADVVRGLMVQAGRSWTKARLEPLVTWAEIEADVRRHRQLRDFARVDAMLERCRDAPRIERARAKLDIGMTGPALEIARDIGAHAIVVAALAGLRNHEEMLAASDAWIAAYPDEGRAHQARGVALMRLRRLVEARDAFDRAALLAPTLTISLLLRRECDQMMRVISERVGDQPPMSLETEPRVDELLAKIESMA